VLPFFHVHFDCVDIHPERDQLPKSDGITSKLLRRADTITSIAYSQIAFLKTLTNKVIHKVPQGFTVPITPVVTSRPKNEKPVFGFAGAISDRFDFQLLKSFVAKNPKWQFEFWGPITAYFTKKALLEKTVKSLSSFSNVSLNGSVTKAEMPNVLARFDVGIIPYDVTQVLNRFCYPMKLYEYYFAGKPVLSTPIPELAHDHAFVYVGATAKKWQHQAEKILKNNWTSQKKNQQKQFALYNSWAKKVAIILKVIQNQSLE
jgi:glycosyltransferase involved in cell wall biosynthesis